MHYANVDRSLRLKLTLGYLKNAGRSGATTADIQRFTGSMAQSTDISELRANGYRIDRTREPNTRNGRQVNNYTLKGRTRTP